MRYIIALCLLVTAFTVVADETEMDGTGLIAHYYKDPKNWDGHWPDSQSLPDVDPRNWTFTEYKYSRMEPVVNHLFVNRGWFSVRWVGYLDTSPGPDTDVGEYDYEFEIFADDGCRLFIDGKKIIDDWEACWEKLSRAKRKSGPVKLSDGKHRIVIEYFQGQSLKRGDQDPMKLYWSCSSRGIPRQILPSSHLLHTAEDKTNLSR